MEFLSIVFIIVASFIWGYLTGKISGLKEGYRNCMKEVLVARCDGRTSLTTSFDDAERKKAMDLLYEKQYDAEEL